MEETKTIENNKNPVQKPHNLPFEKENIIRKMRFFIIVIRYGQANAILNILNSIDASAAFITSASGGSFSHHSSFNADEHDKQAIFTIIREDKAPLLKERLEARFSVSRAASGIAYSIELSSIAGVSMYKFLSNTRKVTKVKKNDK